MKNKVYLSLVIIIAIVCVAGWTAHSQGQRSNSARQLWEYKSLYIENFDQTSATWFEDAKPLSGPVNVITKTKELGDQGWELVSLTPLATSAGSTGRTTSLAYWFKRPK